MTDAGLVAVVRANTADEAIRIADACLEGGCPSIEHIHRPRCAKVIEGFSEQIQ